MATASRAAKTDAEAQEITTHDPATPAEQCASTNSKPSHQRHHEQATTTAASTKFIR